ncbi:ubiquinol-cytochrome c reductase cytochrome c subunit [Micromonospora purpureochromogenes]|uniref:Ubiquinol-cytochrome c reductase cytochrome c subunit n=1 Tax=Micromonospora purpureochromogenes TaxID=47872 RepID=A0A1C4ZSS4_9ACTN|nr:c-type cytochrome [Micromonospora purpureochromogenes]SCF35811.1 ubiquinol-cytochrome c reductase cytochrome c subunit [Micromonospora purpureochromogenes]
MRRSRAATRRPALHPHRALAVGAVLMLAAGPVALAPAPIPGESATPAASAPPPGTGGTRLYREQCASCHGDQGQGTQRGPSLIGVGPASVDFQLSTGRMPVSREVQQPQRRQPALSADDIAALVAHVDSFGGGGPQIPRAAAGSLTSGREIFAANCAPCHGATGSGAALTAGWSAPPLYDATATQVAEAVRVGPGLMPVFPGQVLDDQQVNDVTAYVQRLRSERLDRGGNPLGRLGPLAEGLVAWVAVLALLVAAARWLGRRAGD